MISKSIRDYISNNISYNSNNIELAYSIYVLLGKALYYSPLYVKYKLDNLVPKSDKIRLDNPFVNCRTWSTLYNELLQEYNIDSKVTGTDKHSLVEFEAKGSIIRCDATLYLKDELIGYTSDLANIKFGFDILFFNLIKGNNREEFRNSIKRVNKRYGINEGFERQLLNGINSIKDKSIEEKMKYIIDLYKRLYQLSDGEVERRQVFERFYDLLFKDINNDLIEYQDRSILEKHIILLDDFNCIETNNGIELIDYEELVNMLNNHEIKLKYEHEYKKVLTKHK